MLRYQATQCHDANLNATSPIGALKYVCAPSNRPHGLGNVKGGTDSRLAAANAPSVNERCLRLQVLVFTTVAAQQ